MAHKTLAPTWHELFRFEVNDAMLQSEPLEFRVMDHDVYSSDDPVRILGLQVFASAAARDGRRHSRRVWSKTYNGCCQLHSVT